MNLLLNDSATQTTPSITRTRHEGAKMDEYQEELLEYQAYEMDPLEPAEDATEL
ncbi:hypothetical protein [Pseudomonas sp. W2-17]|uniref:hypothetical protein n=1 Tax=Pseudomonas sp. W2-17 TaxID=3058039 RepID=UPI0034E062E9